MRGYNGTSLPEHTDTIKPITCPFTGEQLTAVPALDLDVGIIHAQQADQQRQRPALGPGRRAEGDGARRQAQRSSPSRRSSTSSSRGRTRVVLPRWVVTRVAHVPGGAKPSYAQDYYDRDNDAYKAWDAVSKDREQFDAWLEAL